jgi:hypothetical protein
MCNTDLILHYFKNNDHCSGYMLAIQVILQRRQRLGGSQLEASLGKKLLRPQFNKYARHGDVPKILATWEV